MRKCPPWATWSRICRCSASVMRSEEDTSALPSHRDLPSFPTRRSSDLYTMVLMSAADRNMTDAEMSTMGDMVSHLPVFRIGHEIGRGHVCTPVTPRSTLFPYTTLFRSLHHGPDVGRGPEHDRCGNVHHGRHGLASAGVPHRS